MREIYCRRCTNPKVHCVCEKRTYFNNRKPYGFKEPKEMTTEERIEFEKEEVECYQSHEFWQGYFHEEGDKNQPMTDQVIEAIELVVKYKLLEKVEQLEEVEKKFNLILLNEVIKILKQ